MPQFFRLIEEADKSAALLETTEALKTRREDFRAFHIDMDSLRSIPGCPFAYWLTERLRRIYTANKAFEDEDRSARQGLATTDDFRFLRAWWEVPTEKIEKRHWVQFARSGGAARYYGQSPLVINWKEKGAELKALIIQRYGNAGKRIYNESYYFRSGFCWPLRGARLAVKAVGPDSVFGIASKMAFAPKEYESAFLSVLNSRAFDSMLKVQAGSTSGVQFESGLVAKTPVPPLSEEDRKELEARSTKIWKRSWRLDNGTEVSHAFYLPSALRSFDVALDSDHLGAEIEEIQSEIDEIVFNSYGMTERDRQALFEKIELRSDNGHDEASGDDEEEDASDDHKDALLSWTIGVAFGRFDWRLATGERESPPEPDPFDPLPAKSPGMLPDGAAPFHAHSGILVDDQSHPHDLPRLIEDVLAHVEADVPGDVRRWLQRDFFPLHLKQYSKSRRKAPIYWPFSTASGSYTLWLYYPSLTSQTLYTAVNDFVEPKLKQVSRDTATLRDKGAARSREDEKAFEALQTLELELIELRDTVLQIAPTYRPNHDDGVQITAAPLWQLFRHKPWQKILKDTWAKLEKGDYDWAHLAMAYWPDRVREKCKIDKSLAIAHELEELYVEPEAKSKKGRGRKAGGNP